MTTDSQDGPDQILPAETPTSTKADQPVRLRIPLIGKPIETKPPISVPGLLKRTADTYPNNPALAYKMDQKWNKITYKEYHHQVRTCAKAFLKLGLERHKAVCILGYNSPEWFIAYLGAIFAGGIAVGIYFTNSKEACFHCANFSKANIIVVQDHKYLQKILDIKSRLSHLKAIIQYESPLKNSQVLSWSKLLSVGKNQNDEELDKTLKNIGVNECCSLVFTSGTVGNPKAVMLSHDNFTWVASAVSEFIQSKPGEEIAISYLPLSHVAAQMVDIYFAITNAGCVYFADPGALKGTLINTLKEVRPIRFFGVPRVWEKIYERIREVASKNGKLKKAIASWAKKQALQHHLNRIKGVNSTSLSYSIARCVIFNKIKKALGLNRCIHFISGAAPLSPEIKKYFLSIDIPIMEGFGLSESAGPHTCCTIDCFGLETTGVSLPGTDTKIIDPEDGHGEICLYGRNIFMGYLNEEEKTTEAVDPDGWLHTGDLGYIDEKNFVYITGRLKELIITAGGENVAPVPIEQQVMAELPHVSNAFLVGDRKKFLSILLTLKTEVDPETSSPLDVLIPSVQDWLKGLGCPAKTVKEVLQDGPNQKLLDCLQEGLDRVNLRANSNAQKIQKFAILPADFSVATGELGPTLKVKRHVVVNKYKDIIEKMYE